MPGHKDCGPPSPGLTSDDDIPLSLPADDGLLMASEVAQLKLNADWVVLSACNTAGGDKQGGEALSGLARAFFYAAPARFSCRIGKSIRTQRRN